MRSVIDRLVLERTNLIRLLILLGVLFANVVLAPWAALGSTPARLLVFACLLVFAGYIMFVIYAHRPVFLLIGCLAGGMFVKFSGPSGLNVSFIGVVTISGLWLMDMLLRQRAVKLVPSQALLPLFTFIVLAVISFGIGQLSWFVFAQHAPLDAQLGGLAIVICSAAAFLLAANFIRTVRDLQTLTWAFIGFGALYVSGRFIQWGGIDRLFHLGFSAGSMFWTWLVALTFSQFLLNRGLKVAWRALLGVILIVTLYVAYVQAYDWKSGWIPPFAAIAAILVFYLWPRVLALVPLGFVPAYYLATQAIGTDQYSWGTRLEAWQIVLEIAKASPLFGLGFSNYYWYTPLFPIRGYYIQFNSHSQYVDLIAQTGILGLGAFLWIFGALGWVGWRLRNRVPAGFAQAYVYGALGGLVGTLVAAALVDWVLPFVYNIGLTGFRASVVAWLFLGGLVSLEQMVRR
jgi:hypothetical protein